MESILNTVKKMLGIDAEYDVFDLDIITCINTAIDILSQVGVRTQGDFVLVDAEQTWEDYLGNQNAKLRFVRNYISLKTRMLFDPPQSSVLADAYTKQLDELLFRISVTVDPGEEE